jgi:hypothetical protein
MRRSPLPLRAAALAAALLLAPLAAAPARAHCDTLDGPVVGAARAALAAGDVEPVLRWIRAADEPEIRDAFARTLAVRGASDAARELADRFFFETLVRVHRAGEGFPFTGLAPAGTPVAPAILAADRALATGDVEPLVAELTATVAAGVRERFARASAALPHAEHHVAAGRAYVAAYVDLTHYAEAIAAAAAGHGGAHGAEPVSHPHD